MDLLWIVCAGFFGTTLMILVMTLICRMQWANADMLRAIGSIFTPSYELSFYYGLVIQYSAGICFGFIYAYLLKMLPTHTTSSMLTTATVMGLVQGLVISLLLVVEVAEHHPSRSFRKAGIGIAVSYVIGHVAYGLTVGICLVAFWFKLSPMSDGMTY